MAEVEFFFFDGTNETSSLTLKVQTPSGFFSPPADSAYVALGTALEGWASDITGLPTELYSISVTGETRGIELPA